MINLEQNVVARKPRNYWPLFIVALLGTHVLLMVVACAIATHDKSFLVAPDYFSRGVNWDQAQAALRASTQLGWHLDVETSEKVDGKGFRTVSFVLADKDGAIIDGAVVTVDYFHHAHGHEGRHLVLQADATDARRFTGLLPMRYPGSWEFHFTVKARGQTFVSSTTRFIENL